VDILNMFQRLNEDEGITVILVTHDPNVARHARRVIHIRDGAISEDAASESTVSTDVEVPMPFAAGRVYPGAWI
jgi:ABC-type lipoprotein export system ATPase subunit